MEQPGQTTEKLVDEVARLRARNAELESELAKIEAVIRRAVGVHARETVERETARVALADLVEELARAHLQLSRLDEMKQNFLSLLSHELRTPISVILGYASILADELGNAVPPDQAEYLRHITEESDKLLALVNNVLDMNRLLTGEMTIDRREVALAEVAQNVVERLRQDAEAKGVRLASQVSEDLPALFSDEQRLGQILHNLVENAVKFTPAGGRVTILAHRTDDSIVCEVEDTGVGIADADIPRLFQVFGQLDPSATRLRGGMGLGLALVRELVVRMGGSIGVRSHLERGSTFWFMLPIQGVGTRPKE